MSEVNGTPPEGLPKSNDPSLEELAERVKLGGPGDMPPPPGHDPGAEPPPVPEAPAGDETRVTLGDVPHPELQPPMPGPGPEPPAPGPERRLATDIFEIEPGTLPPHRFAALFPLMTPYEHAELRDAIEICGQQVLAVRFQGQLLDGRNRDIACKELGIKLRVVDYLGTEDEAFDYVTNANRFQRDLSASQRGAVGARLLPEFSGDMKGKRIEKLRETLRRKREGESSPLPADTDATGAEAVSAHAVAAQIMGVSTSYVAKAARVQREDPELFQKIWNGEITITAAIRQLDGITDSEYMQQARTLRRRMNMIIRGREAHPDFLERLARFLDEFDEGG